MSGHSKWAKIKRKKAVADVKRGKIMTKLLREIQVAAKLGGGNPDGNPRLKVAIQSAKSMSVPSDNIERAVKRGAGADDEAVYEEITYEGYGPGGVALMVKVLTDNRNRTTAEVRHALTRANGSLGGSNCVAFLFDDRGILTVAKQAIDEDRLLEAVLEAGAEDVADQEDVWEVTTLPTQFGAVCQALDKLGVKYEGQVQPVPKSTVEVSGASAESIVRLVETLEELDDVQSVVANFEIDEAELSRISG